MVERLNTYLQLHYMLLTRFEKKVRDLLVEAIKQGMDEGFHELAVQADEFQGNHQDGAPIPGTGDVVQVPKSRPFGNCWSRTACRVWQNGLSAGRQQRPHRRPAAKNARPRSLPGQRRRRRRRARTRVGSVFPPVMSVQAGVVRRYLPPQRVPVRPRQPHHLHSRPCRTRRRIRSASTAAPDSAADPATAAAAAAGGRGVQQPSVANFSRIVGGGRGGGGGCVSANAGRGGAGRCGF